MSAEGVPDRSPRATYRLQLNAGFGFAEVARIAPYLAALGVSHVYLSPILQARSGSTHGYDVVDPRRVSAELGGEAGYAALSATLGRHGLGQVLDIVPNHMAIGPENPWWSDVLENGQASRYADYFDVDWDHPEPYLRDRVLLPVLEDHYGRVLEAGELRLEWDGSAFTIRHGEQRFPVTPPSLEELLGRAAERAGSDELAFVAGALGRLPASTRTDRASVERRERDRVVLVRRLATLAAEDPGVAEAIDAVVAATNADVDALDRLLERQHYRLAWWRSARRDLGYRRFFDVTTLVGLRMEDERVFDETHRLVLGWLADGVLDGVRVDHPDGLRDPEGYTRRLRWASQRAWIVVEKVLEPGEELRRAWPVDGTTGYDVLNEVLRVLVDPGGEQPLSALLASFTGDDASWEEVAAASKHVVLRDVLGSELGTLTSLLLDVLERHRRHRDHTRHDLHEALRALLVAFPVYRTYVRPAGLAPPVGDAPPGGQGHVAPEDEATIRSAVDLAKERRPDLPPDLFDVIADLLLLRITGDLETEFLARFQQLTGPVMAKGVEDTAFYRYLRLVGLNEVGGDPGRFATSVAELHAQAAARQERWPSTMLATSTHDTKRSEDVRARLLVLSEVPDRWAEAVARWSEAAAIHRSGDLPDRPTEYLLYQTLVGAWPIDEERLTAYLTKAVREARLRTSWTEPDEAYERAVLDFSRGVLADPSIAADVGGFVQAILVPGRVNGLAQTLLKLTSSGEPDLYQGCELWDLSLVDPDNRRPVDFGVRRELLAGLDGCTPEDLVSGLADPRDPGRAKLRLIRDALAVRARHASAFGAGAGGRYEPLDVEGERAAHAVAFVRGGEVAVVVPRLTVSLAGEWAGTAVGLPDGDWRDAVTGETRHGGQVGLADLLARFPVALLERIA